MIDNNRENGVGLIALVITIIVLLIIAGAAVSIALNGEGIFSKANNAKEEWNEKVSEEYNTLNNTLSMLDGLKPSVNEPDVPSSTDKVEVKKITWIYDSENDIWEENESEQSDWYNYDEGRWANIKTVNKENENTAYWVWIPRFAYSAPSREGIPTANSSNQNKSVYPEFEILFVDKNNNPLDSSKLNEKEILTDIAGGISKGEEKWIVHPAFTFGETELSGIWVAKYEASSTNPEESTGGGNSTSLGVNVIPNEISWRGLTATNMFANCINMKESGGALEGLNVLDPHMIKNVEWGAVAYLTQSKYGQMRDGAEGQVWINPSEIYKTGQAGTGPDVSSTGTTDNYNRGNGPKASTTGNVYGIYDMSGGAWEYVSAYISNNAALSSDNLSNLTTAASKYVDVYEVDDTIEADSTATDDQKKDGNYAKLTNENRILKWGDAVYETSTAGLGNFSWQKDSSNFPYASEFFFRRSGGNSSGSGAGLFYFYNATGSRYNNDSFRPVCIGIR